MDPRPAHPGPSRRRILLSGATHGLGRALVDRFAESGQQVIGCGRSKDRIDELNVDPGPPHDFATLDVSSDSSVRAWAERVLRDGGAPDLIINNAALINAPAPLWEVSAAEFDRLMAVNVSGVVNVVRAFVPSMIASGQGVIVNLSSGWGRSAAPDMGPYCASKWAIEGLSRSLAQELPPGLACVALNPGIIDTKMLRIAWGDGAAAYPNASEWSWDAARFLLGIGSKDNGRALSLDRSSLRGG